jgi:hypothetical protein
VIERPQPFEGLPLPGCVGECVRRHGGKEKQAARPHREWGKTEAGVERRCIVVFGVDNDCEDRHGPARAQYAAHRVGEEKAADAAPAYPIVASEAPDQSGRDIRVAGQFAGNRFGYILERELERAQAVEAGDAANSVIDRHEYARNVSPLVLACPMAKPLVKLRLTAREGRAIVLLCQRLDPNGQSITRRSRCLGIFRSSEQLAMAPERCDQFLGRRRWIGNRVQEHLAVASSQNHAFMLVEHAARALIGQVSGG